MKHEIYFERIFLHSPGGSLEIGFIENKKKMKISEGKLKVIFKTEVRQTSVYQGTTF
jgi:hypothetical protein